MRTRLSSALALLAGLIISASLLVAQSERGSITGVVADNTGAVLPNLPVTITNAATNTASHVTTTASGEYSAPNLAPGVYRLEVSAPGFKRFVEGSINVTAGTVVRVDPRLEIGQVSESIEIQASAAQVQTENARVSTAVQNRLVDELPLVVGGALRSPFDLVSVAAESKGSGNALSLGGGQAASWGATLDGLAVNTNRSADATETAYITPSVEAITEFSVDTNGFKAEYGQAGGGVITFVSKSGTNAFHGTAYDFLRNDDLDARNFFAATRSVYKQNDFGGTIGGPVLVPKLYNGRNRTFFFASYEGFRNRIGQNGSSFTVPTAEMYQGNFTNWVDSKGAQIKIYDPATTRTATGGGMVRDPFPNNQIPISRFSTTSTAILGYAKNVVPNRPGLIPGTSAYVRTNYVVGGGTTTTPTDKGSIKVDQNFGSNHHVGFFYNRTAYTSEPGPSGPVGLPTPLNTGSITTFDSSAYRATYDWTISPRMLNHLSFGTNTFSKNSYSLNVGGNWQNKVCIKNVVNCDINFPNFTFSDISSWGGPSYNGTEQPMWSLKNDLSYILNNHTLKFGYTYESQRANGFGQQNIAGQAAFSFLETAVPGQNTAASGSSFASFLLGLADSGATETVRYLPQTYPYNAFYAQDDWRITKRLTLNLGLRYEFSLPPKAGNDQYSDFTPDAPNPAVNGYPGALRFAGSGAGRTGTSSLVPGFYGGWGPRFGAAYAINDKTTIRTAYARTFSRVTVVASSNHYSGFIGQYNFASTDQGLTPAFSLDTGLPAYPLPPQINPAFSNNQNVDWWQGQDATRAPELNLWTFSLQRQISASTVFEADYNGSAGSHLQTGLVNVNQVPMSVVNALVNQYGSTQALNILRAKITDPIAVAAGIRVPYANFLDPTVQRTQTVAQALRPYPQYLTIDTSQGGDKSGHSAYHALILKLDRRFSGGLTFLGSYSFSKLLTDSDTYYANAGFAQDNGNRSLEKSIGAYDQTHSVKLSTLYELPVGRGKRWLNHGFLSQAVGGWRVSAIQIYTSGTPISLLRNAPLPIFNGQNRAYITTYDGWRAPTKGDQFDPAVDNFFNPSAFPAQPTTLLGNATRFNPKVRGFPNLNENVSLAKSFHLTEKFRLDFRAEAFNLFNRVVFSSPSTNLNSNTFGQVTAQSNQPRQMQGALKLYW